MTKLYILTFIALVFISVASSANAKDNETTYERVTRTKILRCGYLPYEPYILKDPNTGQLSGVTVDYLNSVASRDGFKIDWSEEVNIDQIAAALSAKKIDAFCLPIMRRRGIGRAQLILQDL